MFKWPQSPSVEDGSSILADYMELKCLQNSSASATDLASDLIRLEDNDYTDGVPEDEVWIHKLDEAIMEIERRRDACRNGYPFKVDCSGNFVYYDSCVDQNKATIYKYMLFATRLRMDRNRIHADLDGSEVFEQLSAEVARAYLGCRSEKFLFGAHSLRGSFGERVEELCQLLGEGEGFRSKPGLARDIKDDKLDVVVWKPFADSLGGKLIAFGQCKTGTSYQDSWSELQPDTFCRQWLLSPPVVTPLRFFLVADVVSNDRVRFEYSSGYAGILFDRCRIVDFGDHVCHEVMEMVQNWTIGAARYMDLSD